MRITSSPGIPRLEHPGSGFSAAMQLATPVGGRGDTVRKIRAVLENCVYNLQLKKHIIFVLF
jgi:hypothetical protein